MAVEDYIKHTIPPFKHQEEYLKEHGHKKIFGLFWQQGCAKSKPIIDTACILYKRGSINGLLVVAPPGVQRNWKSDEIPKHMQVDLKDEKFVHLFETKKKKNKSYKQQENYLLNIH